jgi:hypothetical protein
MLSNNILNDGYASENKSRENSGYLLKNKIKNLPLYF